MAATSYQLKLQPNVLFDSNQQSVQFQLSNIFTTIDTRCSGNGDFDSGFCFCKSGFAGIECSLCDIGYQNVNTDPNGPVNCVQKTGKLCLITSCGCDPRNNATCIPIGKCYDQTGAIVCVCPSNFESGSHCEKCADGYGPYSNACPKIDTCNCIRGTCNTATNICDCPPHYGGPTCNECAAGYYGDDCSQVSPVGPSNPPANEKVVNGFKIFGIILTVVCIVLSIGWLLYRRFGYKPVYVQLDPMEDTFEHTELEGEDKEPSIRSSDL